MDSSSRIPFERIKNMSLDEYIQEKGLSTNRIPPPYKSPHTEGKIEDIPEEIVIKQEEDVEMSEAFDLRSRISSNNQEQLNIKSQQWRLLSPNKSQNRPSGMPPLVPKDKDLIHFNNSQPLKNTPKWGNRWNRNRYRAQQYQNHRNNRHREENSQATPTIKRTFNQQPLKKFGGKNNTMGVGRRTGFEQWNQQNRPKSETLDSPVMNMTIEAAVCNNSLVQSSLQSNNLSETNQPLQTSTSSGLGTLQPSSFLDGSGGVKLELMPFIAGKLLEALQGTSTVNTPKYDLKIQREIHSLQNKPMIYKCPGGEVVSSDGPGLPCKLKPTSTGMSLNQRFA